MNQFLNTVAPSASSSSAINDWKKSGLALSSMMYRKELSSGDRLPWISQYYHTMLQQSQTTFCDGRPTAEIPRPPNSIDDYKEPPCSTCKYTGMAVCTGMTLYFLKLANELESSPKSLAQKAATKNHKPFFYGGAVFWACVGIYRSILD